MQSKDGLTAEFMLTIFRDGVIGYKEFRSWLADTFESFASVRDAGIDGRIDEIARMYRNQRQLQNDEDSEETP